MVITVAVVAVAATLGGAAAAQLPLPDSGDDLAIRLVTFGPGDDIFNYFGHNALMVEDTRNGYAVLYNFGMFHFGPEMLPKYMMGRLEFWAGATSVVDTFRIYEAMNRDIFIDTLDLPPTQRWQLAKRLATVVQPQNRDYLYHHYQNNCSTRIRDLLDQAVDGQLRRANSGATRRTFRVHTRRCIERNWWLDPLLMYWMNDELDAPIAVWSEAFLPDQLRRQVKALHYRDAAGVERALVRDTRVVYQARGRRPLRDWPRPLWPWTLGWGLAIAGAAFGLRRWRQSRSTRLPRLAWAALHIFVGLLLGVPAMCLAFMALWTDHSFAYWNETLLLANPLTFLAVPLGIGIAWGSLRAERWMGWIWRCVAATTGLAVLLKLLPMFDQDIRVPLTMFIPVNFAFAAASFCRPFAASGAKPRR